MSGVAMHDGQQTGNNKHLSNLHILSLGGFYEHYDGAGRALIPHYPLR